MTKVDKTLLLLDDGNYYIERNCNGDPLTTNGFLHRRYVFGTTKPAVYECLGSYERTPSGEWTARINAAYDPTSDCDACELGSFKRNVEAIAALWKARYKAHTRF
jgi:hypothetical protein